MRGRYLGGFFRGLFEGFRAFFECSFECGVGGVQSGRGQGGRGLRALFGTLVELRYVCLFFLIPFSHSGSFLSTFNFRLPSSSFWNP